jgi:hypothetical protein
MNGYGIGSKSNNFDASTLSLSSSGLIPSFGKNISLQNPSTWHYLNFTYFSTSYGGNLIGIDKSVENGSSAIESIQLTIPIKNKYSFGIGLMPLLNQYIELESINSKQFIAFDDTIDIYSTFESYGGINELSFSIGGIITKHLNAALKIGFLYGSNRRQDIFSLDELDYYSQERFVYSGSLAKVFINSDLLTSFDLPIKIYLGYGFPLKSISAKSIRYPTFEDSDDSGFQDSGDFPSSLIANEPHKETIKNVSSLNEYQFGFDYEINNELSLLSEVYYLNDATTMGKEISVFKDQIESIFRMNIGLARFGSSIIKKPIDRFNIKISTYLQNIDLLIDEKMIKEYGVSTGLSFNFGFSKNQIDLAYSIGKRQGLIGIGDEKIQRYSIGISLGDIWFIKRRSR